MTQVVQLTPVQTMGVIMGCDPEFFFQNDKGKIIGAERIIPEEGLRTTAAIKGGGGGNLDASFVIDGVQAELHPQPQSCRAFLANEISACMRTLKATLEKQHAGVRVSFDQSVVVDPEELSKLNEKYQKLGCSPSLNTYEDTSSETSTGVKLKAIDPLKHTQRSAGGHIHLGIGKVTDPVTLVKLLDIIVGNTCVLVDRDPGNVERRKLYGYAGEYRLPRHGIEYRTPSNFWLKSYPLMSMVFGLARLAVEIYSDRQTQKQTGSIKQAFLDAVDIEKVRKAINDNDFELAYENFKLIEGLLCQVCGTYGNHPISSAVMKEFHIFVQKIKEEGIEFWFPEDPMEHWCNLPEAHWSGFHAFLLSHVTSG